MSDHARDDWAKCPPGELSRLAARLQARRRRRDSLRAAAVLPVIALVFGIWALWPVSDEPPKPGTTEYDFARIPCSRVMELAEAYGAGTLSTELREQVRQHVAQCPHCGPRYQEMGLVAWTDYGTPQPLGEAGNIALLASVLPGKTSTHHQISTHAARLPRSRVMPATKSLLRERRLNLLIYWPP